MTDQIATRLAAARTIADAAGQMALNYFHNFDSLTIHQKGHQDLVSEADRNVETLVRARIAATFPDDAIIGEEQTDTPGTSGFTWVIDPIDGTANFVRGIPAWCVVLAVVEGTQTVAGVIHDPVHGEACHARTGHGAFCNDTPITVAPAAAITHGSIGLGFSARSDNAKTLRAADAILSRGGIFFRNASGALMLSYVARGRLLGYLEQHMNPWDCIAGQLLIAEAGGQVECLDSAAMLSAGGRVVAGAPGIWDDLQTIASTAYGAP